MILSVFSEVAMHGSWDNLRRSLWLGGLLALAACGTSPVHDQERFDPSAPYQYQVPTRLETACAAARYALLSQGYALEEPNTYQLKATKAFQPDEESHALIEFNVVCAETRKGTTLFVNALEKRYGLKKSSQSAGLSVSSLGSISLPWGSTNESLVMVSNKTIDDPMFYKRYYDLVDGQLGIVNGR